MKGKIIRAFLAVYLVLSMAYGGIRTVYNTVKAAPSADTAGQSVELQASESVLPDSAGRTEAFAAEESASAVDQRKERPEEAVSRPPEDPGTTEGEVPALQSGDESLQTEFPDTEESEDAEAAAMPPEETAEDVSEYGETDESYEAGYNGGDSEEEDDAVLDEAPAEDTPSLEEYLSTLQCGRCGRNCALSNPHCRTGRSKAESEAYVYYETYGAYEQT